MFPFQGSFDRAFRMKNSFFTVEEGDPEVVVIKRLGPVSKGRDENTKQQPVDSLEPLRYESLCSATEYLI